MIDIIPGKPEDAIALIRAAKTDNHSVLEATHLLKKDGMIVGFLSIGAVPTFYGWFDTKRTNARDAMTALTYTECELKAHGARWMFLPTGSQSPFTPYLGKLQFHKLKFDEVYLKKL